MSRQSGLKDLCHSKTVEYKSNCIRGHVGMRLSKMVRSSQDSQGNFSSTAWQLKQTLLFSNRGFT